MTKYKVIEGENLKEFTEEIEGLIKNGWKLEGGVSITRVPAEENSMIHTYYICYAQSMTKYFDDY